MRQLTVTTVGKLIQHSLRRLDKGGQALPGLVVEKLYPGYLTAMLQQLPEGVVIVTGTNGKTTTTKIVVELLRAEGKKVITNATGSNLSRGFISSILHHTNWLGQLPYDLAVLEMDEAYAEKFVRTVKPSWVLALNVTRDQLDRFGEVDKVARLVGATMRAARVGVVVNGNDQYLAPIGQGLAASGERVTYFGVNDKLVKHFFNEATVASVTMAADIGTLDDICPRVQLTKFDGQDVVYDIDGTQHQVCLQLTGQHNFQNAAAALALASELLPNVPATKLIEDLSHVTSAFGRGEVFKLQNGSHVQLVLVKNPAAFAQSLASYQHENAKLMFAINDNYADGRDVSWLWDVDFSSLRGRQVSLTTGSRAADMALRLKYDGVEVEKVVDDLSEALEQFSADSGQKVIFATYTAMLKLYGLLRKGSGNE